MARPLRLQFPGALYHVMSRGNGRQDIFLDDADRLEFFGELTATAARMQWRVLAYCLMHNHYHLCLETGEPSLAEGMRNLNSRYGQRFNRLHGRVGHVFQGRYKAILVEQPGYLLELARYIVLNPVRAGRVVSAVDWPWSSYRAMLGLSPALGCLDVTYLLRQFSDDPARAREGFAAFVAAGDPAAGAPAPGPHPLVHGGAAFINQVFGGVPATALGAEIPRLQRASLTLHELEQQATSRNDAMRRAWATGHYPLAAIARHFGVHYTTVSRICRSAPLAAARVPEETNGNSG